MLVLVDDAVANDVVPMTVDVIPTEFNCGAVVVVQFVDAIFDFDESVIGYRTFTTMPLMPCVLLVDNVLSSILAEVSRRYRPFRRNVRKEG